MHLPQLLPSQGSVATSQTGSQAAAVPAGAAWHCPEMTQPVAACTPALQAAAAAGPLDAVLLPVPAHTHRHFITQAWGFKRQSAALTASDTQMHVQRSTDSAFP